MHAYLSGLAATTGREKLRLLQKRHRRSTALPSQATAPRSGASPRDSSRLRGATACQVALGPAASHGLTTQHEHGTDGVTRKVAKRSLGGRLVPQLRLRSSSSGDMRRSRALASATNWKEEPSAVLLSQPPLMPSNMPIMLIAPGPMTTTKSAGRMHTMRGKRILTVTFCAFSSAF